MTHGGDEKRGRAKKKPKWDGKKKIARKDTLTPRDDAIMRALFFCRYVSTSGMATLFFNSKSAARRRLSELADPDKGYLDSRQLYLTMPTWDRQGKHENIYHLTKKGFEQAAESLGLYDERFVSRQLGQKGAVHHAKTAELFVAAEANLDQILGSYPAWEWEHEKKAEDSYEYDGSRLRHQSDAHVHFSGHTFIVERQTRESRIGQSSLSDKLSAHATWARTRTDDPEKVEALFACDDRRVAEQAERAGERYGIEVMAGSVEEVAYYLYQSALRLAPDDGGMPHAG